MISHLNQVMLLREARLKNGIDIIEMSNGILHVTLNVSHALDIYQILYRGKNISFLSKNGLNAKEGQFAERFEGGMLYTCGLDAIGGKSGHMQHGMFHLQRAEILHAEATEEEIVVEAKVEQTSLFQEHFIVKRKIRLAKDSSSLEILDTLVNASYQDVSFALLYHFNFGYPFLDENTKIQIDSKSQTGVTPFAQEHVKEYTQFGKPIQKEEQVIYHEEVSNFPLICGSFANITIEYDHSSFPYLIEWKSMIDGDYALGIEPSTSKFNEQFTYSTLMPKEEKHFHFVLKVKENR